jgi:hypothetical protein
MFERLVPKKKFIDTIINSAEIFSSRILIQGHSYWPGNDQRPGGHGSVHIRNVKGRCLKYSLFVIKNIFVLKFNNKRHPESLCLLSRLSRKMGVTLGI